jgi:hypothetical protein
LIREKRGGIMRLAVLLASFSLCASSAIAQEVQQTPEGAHRFLALISENQKVILNYSRFRFPEFTAEYRIQFVRASECQTSIEGQPTGYAFDRNWQQPDSYNFQARITAYMQRYNLPTPPLHVDWSKVGSVEIANGLIADNSELYGRVILIRQSGGLIQTLYEDQATAKRVQYAMQFLKEACDQTAETGF